MPPGSSSLPSSARKRARRGSGVRRSAWSSARCRESAVANDGGVAASSGRLSPSSSSTRDRAVGPCGTQSKRSSGVTVEAACSSAVESQVPGRP